VSRIPRFQEHLKTAFTAEAASAARSRAYAVRAESDGLPNLARHWRALAEEKDRLAIELLHAAGKVESEVTHLRDAISTEQYEDDVLYPRMVADMEDLGHPEEAALLRRIVETQQRHQAELDDLRRELTASTRDVRGPAVAKAG